MKEIKMYSDNLKLSLLKINQIKLILVQLEKFLRFKIIVFHVVTSLWHFWLNLNTFIALRHLFQNRWDIVEKTCGFGSQYITVWNQVILQVYFTACLVIDFWELKFHDRCLPARGYLKKMLPFCFTSFVFPVSFIVAINFWTYYSIEREIIDEDNVMAQYIPEWINHGLHTTIVLLVCIEKVLVRHSYPPKFWAFLGVSSLLVSYAITCLLLYIWSGLWPYPLIRGMTTVGRISFVILNCVLGIFIVAVGESVNNKLWGTKVNAVTCESLKKSVKVS